jgi:hypothetical protein
LREIPVSRKKRLVRLKWPINSLEPDISYMESKIEAVLTAHDADCATLRREMVGCGELKREKGVYRRGPKFAGQA